MRDSVGALAQRICIRRFGVGRSHRWQASAPAGERCRHRQRGFVRRLSYQYVTDFPVDPLPLIKIENADIGYPGAPIAALKDVTMTIQPAEGGGNGHVLLGANGSGKSLLAYAIANNGGKDYIRGHGTFETIQPWYSSSIAKVSFVSHQELLELSRQLGGLTASKAISDRGSLNKAAQFLVVRFGLYHLLQRDVSTLSTGEIRKVLLIRALSTRPKLLILDNAFDGLDVESREILKELVSSTLRGFKQDVLVQAINSKATARSQVLLLTHRTEEIVDEIETISYIREGRVETKERQGRTGQELFHLSLFNTKTPYKNDEFDVHWDDPALPATQVVSNWWNTWTSSPNRETQPLVGARNLRVERGDSILLENLDWTIRAGERWLVAGGNGAGKSTLSRLLANMDDSIPVDNLEVLDNTGFDSSPFPFPLRNHVGWVSTELHMAMAQNADSVDSLLSRVADRSSFEAVCGWLGVDFSGLRESRFCDLSQGQQKMLLLSSALSLRPKILVLDEPVQGLDLLNRKKLLGVVERICRSTDMTLVYITHHFEELLPSVTHVLHLKDRRAVFNGPVGGYDPNEV